MIIINSIEINNFRSIVKLDKGVVPNHLNIIVGQNDIGKSNFLKALNLFFNGETDIGSPFRFKDDFSNYAITPNKKAPEVIIKINFNSSERYKTSEDLTWTKVWRRDGLHSDEIYTKTGKIPSKKSGALQWVKKVKYKYVPAVRGNEYFNYLMGDLHDALSEINPSAFNDASLKFIEGLKSQVSLLVNDITNKLGYSSEIGMPSDFKMLFSTLDFSLNKDGNLVSLNKRGDGIKAQHIPVILKFIANHHKSVSGRAIINPETIWGFEEPENNMEMGNAFKLAKIFASFSEDIQIFINTHSPAFYLLAKDNITVTSLFLVKAEDTDMSTKLLEVSIDDINLLDEEIGILPIISEHIKKEVELRQAAELKIMELSKLESRTRYLVLTEDQDTSFCELLFNMQGFTKENTEFVSYHSRSNLLAAIQACKIKLSEKPKLEHIIFHRDSDVYDNDEHDRESVANRIASLNKDSRIKHTLFKTKGYDLESYFVNAEHIHTLYPTIPLLEIQFLIKEATDQVEEKSLDKLLNKVEIYRKGYEERKELIKFSHSKYYTLLTNMYKANPERYRYGKTVLGVLTDKLNQRIRKTNLKQVSDKIIIPELVEIVKPELSFTY